ncbi:MAG: hypothetical protein QM495_01710 [Lutibacter sp.]
MKTESFLGNYYPKVVSRVAKRNYNTYVTHYKSRNLTPMSLEEFLKNYAS